MDIELQGVGKRYHARWLFKDLSAKIPSGESLALTGKNGSGKSTLLQIIYQYVVPTKGKIIATYQGKQLTDHEVPAHAAFVSPYLELPEELTTLEAVKFHFGMRKGFHEDYQSIIASCGLEGSENKQIRYFSSGMKQRLKLALAFHTDCALLLLDEPCSNLDKQGVEWYCDMIKNLKGKPTIIVASNQEYEYNFCQQTIFIDGN